MLYKIIYILYIYIYTYTYTYISEAEPETPDRGSEPGAAPIITAM